MAFTTPSAVELQALAGLRLNEAGALISAGLYDGAWYLAGYAVECALKAVICRTLGLSEYPDKVFKGNLKTHVLPELVVLSGLTGELAQRSSDSAFAANWDVVRDWDPQQRYEISRSEQDARELMSALTNAQSGVFTWLSNRW